MHGGICERIETIMGDEMLASVCELAFDVAKEGSAPSAMKNYLYLAQRPPRAYSVAQRSLEEDAKFRARVAARATIDNVGEGGYLWLHRPAGWEGRFAALNASGESLSDRTRAETPLAERPPMPEAPGVAPPVATPSVPADAAPATPTPAAPTPATQIPAASASAAAPALASEEATSTASQRAPKPVRPAGAAPTVSSIEEELSSLRGLVDRLADERQNVRSSVSELEVELETRRAENIEMSARLSSLRTELTTVQSTEATILLERDRALARVTELEADVARLNSEVERLAAESEGSTAEHEAALTDLASAASERDALKGELDAVVTDRNSLSGQFSEIRTERDQLSDRLNAVTAERDELTEKLQTITAERNDVQSRLAAAATQNREITERLAAVDQLTSDNAELASRVAVAEQARVDLEGQLEEVSEKWKSATRQLSVFENVNRQLDDAVAGRTAAEEQLRQTNTALASLGERIGVSHESIRSELTGIEAAFVSSSAAMPPLDEPVGDTAALDDSSETALPETSLPETAESESSLPETSLPELAESETAESEPSLPEPAVSEAALPDVEIASGDVSTHDVALEGEQAPEAIMPVASVDASDVAIDAQIDVDPEPAKDLEGAADFAAPDFAAPDFAPAGVTDVGDIDVPSFEDSAVTFENVDDGDTFDGVGIEMDPTTLGGRTIGDMFGEAPTDASTRADEVDTSGSDMLDAADLTFSNQPSESADTAPAGAVQREVLAPGGLDEAAFARYVVTSPDVVLLIDGDGAAGLGWPHLDVATRRSALVEYLGSLTADSGAAADVVFVRPVGDEDALPVSRAVRVRIADHPVAESPIFASIVDGYPQEWPIAMVTNESTLLAQADDLGVATLSNDQLLDLFLDLNPED